MGYNVPSHLALHSLPFCSRVLTDTIFAANAMPKFKDDRVHLRNSGVKG